MVTSYLTIQSPLDESVKRNHKFDIQLLKGEERISADFSYQLKISSLERLSDEEIKELIGHSVSIKIGFKDKTGNDDVKWINGIVYQLTELGNSRAPLMPEIWRYELSISSWLKKLDYITDCRIFQKAGNTSISIITDLLKEMNFHDFKTEGLNHLPRRDITVIYNESVGHFMRRLFQEDGIIWRIEHQENRHDVIFSQDSTGFPKIPANFMGQTDIIKHFCKTTSHIPIKNCILASYDWETPPVKIAQKGVRKDNITVDDYNYSIGFTTMAEGESKARRRQLALDSYVDTVVGKSTIRTFAAGVCYTLNTPLLPDLSGETFLIKSLQIEATKTTYSNRFEAMPAKHPFMLLEEDGVKKPKVLGPQTAVVVGDGGMGQVQTDSLGRIKVRFHWDHHSPTHSTRTSAYLRVAMPAAGVKRGFLFTPRIGEEVVVDFEDGNPDKPFIIGSVYSKTNPPPFEPSVHPFKSTIKNGPDKDANQIVFDDKPGAENLNITAKKEMTINVDRHFTMDVTKDATITSTADHMVARNGVEIRAGNEINSMSLVNIIHIAAKNMTNTAGKNILNMAAGMVSQQVGGILTNLAKGLLANTAILGIKQSAKNSVTNESKMMASNTAASIINAGEQSTENKAKLAMVNKAATDISSSGKEKKIKATLMTTTQAGTFMVEGDTTVGP